MKQIIAMMLSASSPELGRLNEGLRRYVLNAQAIGLPEGINVFAALTRDKDARQAGGAGVIKNGRVSVISEVALAPLILVITLGGTEPPDGRLVNITAFASVGYDDRGTIELPLPVLDLHAHYPGAYR